MIFHAIFRIINKLNLRTFYYSHLSVYIWNRTCRLWVPAFNLFTVYRYYIIGSNLSRQSKLGVGISTLVYDTLWLHLIYINACVILTWIFIRHWLWVRPVCCIRVVCCIKFLNVIHNRRAAMYKLCRYIVPVQCTLCTSCIFHWLETIEYFGGFFG